MRNKFFVFICLLFTSSLVLATNKNVPPPSNDSNSKSVSVSASKSTSVSASKSNTEVNLSEVGGTNSFEGGTNSFEGDSNSFNGGDSKNESMFFATTAVNLDGCMTGKGIGGGGNGGGGLVQWGSLNMPCFFDQLAKGERHVEMRARLACASKPFRNAIIFNPPKGTKAVEIQQMCIDYSVKIWKSEIDYLREFVVQETSNMGK